MPQYFRGNFLADWNLGWGNKIDLKRVKLYSYPRRDDQVREGDKHFNYKEQVFNWLFDNTEFYVMTELQQVRNHFKSFRDPNAEIFFRMDVCAIRPSDSQVLDIEIDGPEHFTSIGKMQDRTRDNWLNERYGIVVHRIDRDDEIDWHKLNQFINCKPSAKKKTPYYLSIGDMMPNLYNEESRHE